jgi:hypothetical protein
MTMLRSILVALGVALGLFAFAGLAELPGGPVTRAIAGVALGVGVSALVYGEATFAAVALGAISPLALAAMDRSAPAVASAVMCLLWLAPRFVLADTHRKVGVLAAASCVAATVAGSIFVAYWEAPLAAHAASCVFAGSCIALVGVLVPVATTTAYALRTAASAIDGPIRDVLLRAAAAHESSRWQPRASGVRAKWRSLVRLSDQRAALERAGHGAAAQQRSDLDERIEAVVSELAPEPAAPKAPAPATMPGAATNEAGPTSASDSALSRQGMAEESSSDDLDIHIEESAPAIAETPTVPPSEV